jgi:hypothetical protein
MKKNNKIHIYYVLLGIGIGLVLASVINIISPNVKIKEYTDEEIIQRARELGMHDLEEIIERNSGIDGDNKDKELDQASNQVDTNIGSSDVPDENTDNADNSNSKIKEEIKKTVDKSDSEKYVEFEVKEGDSSQKVINNLYEANIIDDKEVFNKDIIRRKSRRKIHFGKFKIPLGVDNDTIIDILTK